MNLIDFKRFCLKLFLFLVVVFLSDFLIGHFLRLLYFKQQSGFDYQTTYAIDSSNADIIILGSSRATNLFNPEIFENELKLSCYNAGRYGYPIFYHYAILKANIQRHVPKIVILSFDAGNFSYNQGSYDQISVLLPYYKTHPEIRDIVNLKGPYEKIKMISKTYPFNSLILPITAGNMEQNKIKYATIKGYIPLTESANNPLKIIDYSIEKKLDSVKVNTFKSFIQLCLNSNVSLTIVCPPYLIKSIGNDLSIETGKKIAKDLNVNFIDFSKDTFYTSRPELFYDFRHLNQKGVGIFSRQVINRMSNPL